MNKKDIFKYISLPLVVLFALIALSYGLDYFNVFRTKTVVKAQQNAETEVFRETQSYIDGKRQEALKFYKEYNKASSSSEKESIKQMVSHSFASFDEEKLTGRIKAFIISCKY